MKEHGRYMLAIDSYKGMNALCLWDRLKSTVEFSLQTQNKKNFDADVERLKVKYNIPETDIITEN